MHFTLSDIQHMADSGSYRRGVDYFKKGQVRQVTQGGHKNKLVAEVAGSGRKAYTTELLWDGGELLGDCSCPVGIDCKHCVATALEWLRLAANAPPQVPAMPDAGLALQQWLDNLPPQRHVKPEE
jgi:uncharacterized Zn finger protein